MEQKLGSHIRVVTSSTNDPAWSRRHGLPFLSISVLFYLSPSLLVLYSFFPYILLFHKANSVTYSACLKRITTVKASNDSKGKILLPPENTILVNRVSLNRSYGAQAILFIQKILTRVFSFDEIMGATLSGQGTKRRGSGRQENGEKKGLDPWKIEAIVCKYNFFSFNVYLKLIQFFILRAGAAQNPGENSQEQAFRKSEMESV